MSEFNRLSELFPQDFFSRKGVERLCREAEIAPSKALGQNFLYQRTTLDAMVRDLEVPHKSKVIEIGCGFGHLTVSILDCGYSVVAFETDGRLLKWLMGCVGDRLQIHCCDILTYDLSPYFEGSSDVFIVGNLPYSSASSMLFYLLKWYERVQQWGFLLQREVGERIKAKPGHREYGRLSVILQYLFEIQVLRRVGPGCFYPRPKVESVWMRLLPRHRADMDMKLVWDWMEPLVRTAFMHRRKKLCSNLSEAPIGARRLTKEQSEDFLKMLDLDVNCRAQDVSPDQYASLAGLISSICLKTP